MYNLYVYTYTFIVARYELRAKHTHGYAKVSIPRTAKAAQGTSDSGDDDKCQCDGENKICTAVKHTTIINKYCI